MTDSKVLSQLSSESEKVSSQSSLSLQDKKEVKRENALKESKRVFLDFIKENLEPNQYKSLLKKSNELEDSLREVILKVLPNKKVRDKTKPKKPAPVFILYSNKIRQDVKKQYIKQNPDVIAKGGATGSGKPPLLGKGINEMISLHWNNKSKDAQLKKQLVEQFEKNMTQYKALIEVYNRENGIVKNKKGDGPRKTNALSFFRNEYERTGKGSKAEAGAVWSKMPKEGDNEDFQSFWRELASEKNVENGFVSTKRRRPVSDESDHSTEESKEEKEE